MASNCPAKYTFRPCLAPSCSSAAALIAVWQHHSISAALPEHLCSIPKAPGSAKMVVIPVPFQLPCPMVISAPSHSSPLPRCSSPEHPNQLTRGQHGKKSQICSLHSAFLP